MLNKRQKLMIRDLERSAIAITARQLAEKHNVSLRTVRNDIEEIASYLREQNIEFIRIPSQGMRIITDKEISSKLNKVLKNSEFPYLDNTQRSIILLFNFLFLNGPLSTVDLCETFDVSKGTIISTVQYANRALKVRNLKLARHQNKGYRLDGTLKNIIKGCEEVIRLESEELVYNTLICKDNHFITDEEEIRLQQTLQYISNDLALYISHHLFLSFMLYCVVCRSRENKRSHIFRNDEKEDKLAKLASLLEELFSIHLNKEAIDVLKHLLSGSTDYSANTSEVDPDSRLPEAVNTMIDYVNSSGMYQINDADTLRVDLLVHLKSTIDAIRSGLPRDNPLLDEIRSSYPNEFNLIKSAAQKFTQFYPLKLDDDEVGYLTLYFLRSFDKVEKMQETKVMVVCNTGRSASKLLATRLINNIPDIHIVSMSSIYNISHNPRILDNVDFVISTIPIQDISKPYVVISPLLQKSEISKVKEAIWLAKSEIQLDDSLEVVTSSILEEENTKLEANESFETRKEYYDAKNIIPYQVSTLLGEVSMNLFYLISDLYPKGIPTAAFGNVSGIYAHVLMAVPRWQRKEFIEPGNDEELIRQNRKQYEAIKKYLHQESERLGIFIPDSEILAILRYYVY